MAIAASDKICSVGTCFLRVRNQRQPNMAGATSLPAIESHMLSSDFPKDYFSIGELLPL